LLACATKNISITSEKGNVFTTYTAEKFTRKNQKELIQFLKECEAKGAK